MRKMPLSGILLIVGGIVILVGLGAYLWKGLGPKPPSPPPTIVGWPLVIEVTMTATPEPIPDIKSTPQPPLPTPFLPEPTPTPAEPWMFDGIDFDSPNEISILFELVDDDAYMLEPFTSHVWTSTTWWENAFGLEGHHGVVWEDSNLRLGIWLHSGDGEVLFPLQEKFERDSKGWFRNYMDAQTYLQEHVYGSRVVIRQNDVTSIGWVKAVVRVGPQAVMEHQTHVMDLIEWLAKHYAGVHFESLIDESEVLMIYSCGRLLNGEKRNPDLPYYQQSRFIIAIMPEE